MIIVRMANIVRFWQIFKSHTLRKKRLPYRNIIEVNLFFGYLLRKQLHSLRRWEVIGDVLHSIFPLGVGGDHPQNLDPLKYSEI